MSKPTKESFKIGRKKFGTLMKWVDGRTCLVVDRSRKDIYRPKGISFISQAIENGTASWSIETLILSKMKSRNIKCLAVKVREDGEMYITTLSRFISEGETKTHRRRNGSNQRSLEFSQFQKRTGRVKL